MLLKPQTFMNRSGGAVANIVRFYKIKPEDILVVHDDVDLVFGEIRHQFSRGSAGHRGVESLMDSLGTEKFNRVRVGVGKPPEKMETEAYVLQNFSEEEKDGLKEITDEAVEVIINWFGD